MCGVDGGRRRIELHGQLRLQRRHLREGAVYASLTLLGTSFFGVFTDRARDGWQNWRDSPR